MLRPAVFVMCLAFAQAAHAQAPEITNPEWLAQPNARDFAIAYPSQAVHQYVEGRATIECFVHLDTTLSCAVTAESPASWGFGDAALAVARSFRVAPARVNGEPVEGGRIRRTIRFVMPASTYSSAGLSPAQQALAESSGELETLPTWEEAPTTAAVLLATPEAARAANTQGRGVLSCRVNSDRRLTCEPHREMPADSGFAAAAMTLVPLFRVSSTSQEFADAHATEPFMLPITFNGVPAVTPVNRTHNGLAPLEGPTFYPPPEFYPAEALAARVQGAVSVLCTMTTTTDIACVVESETPNGWGFANKVMELIDMLPPPPPEMGLLPGDQMRLNTEFLPQ